MRLKTNITKSRKTIDSLLPFRLFSIKVLKDKLKLLNPEINLYHLKLCNRIYDYLNIINNERIDNKIRKSFKKKGRIRDRHRKKYLKAWVKRKTNKR